MIKIHPQNIKNRSKTDPKIDHLFDASWARFFLFVGGLLLPHLASWYQHRIKQLCNFCTGSFKNCALAIAGGSIPKALEVEVGNKIDQKSIRKRNPRCGVF